MRFIKLFLLLLVLTGVPLVWAADTKISALPAVVTRASTDEFPVNQGGTTKKETLAQIWTAPVFAAGTSSAGTWPLFTSGTVLSTAEDGAVELDADVFYGTTDAGNRGYLPVRHFIRAASAQTLTSTTNAQSIFDSPANGQITLETGTYLFELVLQVSGMSGTSGNAQILFAGTGTFGGWNWFTQGLDNTTRTTISADLAAWHVTNATAASVVTAGTGTGLRVYAKGSFECTAAGTLIPQIDLVTASAATVVEGSYFTLERIGATATASVGQWD